MNPKDIYTDGTEARRLFLDFCAAGERHDTAVKKLVNASRTLIEVAAEVESADEDGLNLIAVSRDILRDAVDEVETLAAEKNTAEKTLMTYLYNEAQKVEEGEA